MYEPFCKQPYLDRIKSQQQHHRWGNPKQGVGNKPPRNPASQVRSIDALLDRPGRERSKEEKKKEVNKERIEA